MCKFNAETIGHMLLLDVNALVRVHQRSREIGQELTALEEGLQATACPFAQRKIAGQMRSLYEEAATLARNYGPLVRNIKELADDLQTEQDTD